MINKSIKNIANDEILISPSLLAADFANLKKEIKLVEENGAKLLHIDVMDGHFVPNISIGVPVVKSLRDHSDLIFDVHLMISNPLRYIEAFAKAGSNHITFHIESDDNPMDVISLIKRFDCTVGISLKPNTPAVDIIKYLDIVDLVLVMTVEPGFGGQSFMPKMLSKIKKIKSVINTKNKNIHLEVDGGIDKTTAKFAKDVGVNMLVAGTSIFRNPKGAEFAIKELKN